MTQLTTSVYGDIMHSYRSIFAGHDGAGDGQMLPVEPSLQMKRQFSPALWISLSVLTI
jgi:hypothetical protein